ncbi:hypothetical protein IPM19_03345 [bacterium]|nr:MAG: hypothetical protein IPM19_03345 [bacterium]
MKKILLTIAAISLLGASCTLSGQQVQVGVVKTANGGVDWQPANKIVNNEKSLLSRSISQMKFNAAGDKIFASSFDGGLFSSEDAGENWTEVLGGVLIYDFAIDPSNENIMYAASYLGDRGRLINTRDGGKTWTEVYSDAGNKNPVRTVAINPNNTTEIMIGLGKGSVISSSDSGNSWKLVQSYNDRITRIHWLPGEVYVLAQETGVFRSTDNGVSFEQITKTLVPTINNSRSSIFGRRISQYRQLAIDPSSSSNLWLATDKGLFRSFNGGSSWNYVNMPFRQRDASPFAVSVAPSSSSVIYASSNSVIFKSLDGGATWSSTSTNTNGLVGVILISRDLPQIAFAGVSR